MTGNAPANADGAENAQRTKGIAVQGDVVDEESSDEEYEEDEEDEEDEEEGPLFETDQNVETTPTKDRQAPRSSSPSYPPSTPKDYSSDIEMSSPAGSQMDGFGFPKRGRAQDEDEDEDEDEEDIDIERRKRRKLEEAKAKEKRERREKRREGRKERTRHYAVVGIVRKKVVFALR